MSQVIGSWRFFVQHHTRFPRRESLGQKAGYRCSLEIRKRERRRYHRAVARGPTRWRPSLALNADEFTTMLGLRAIPSAHRLLAWWYRLHGSESVPLIKLHQY